MKKKVVIPAICFAILSVSASTQVQQPVKKIYGYKQASIPGILHDHRGENDTPPTGRKPTQHFNYWFYLEIPKPEKIKLTGLWIAGIRHDITAETVSNLPVKKIILAGMEKNDTAIMVPTTRNNVMLIYPSGESRDTTLNSKYPKGLTNKNELVISYLWKNRQYHATLKKLKELDPDVRQ